MEFDAALNSSNNNCPLDYLAHSVSFEKAVNVSNVSALDITNNTNENLGLTHYWVFTFLSFLALLRDCLRFNLLPYTLEYAKGTILTSNEFHIVLKKDTDIQINTGRRLAEISKINQMIEFPKGKNELVEFIEKYESIYIYGSPQAAQFLIEGSIKYSQTGKIKGLVISDNFKKEFFELPIYHLSEISLKPNVGIIMAMTEGSIKQVKKNLQNIGFNNILEGVAI